MEDFLIYYKLREKIKRLKRDVKKYKNKYLFLLDYIKNISNRKKIEEKNIKEILIELDILLNEIKDGFDKVEKLEKKLDLIEREVYKLKLEIERLKKFKNL